MSTTINAIFRARVDNKLDEMIGQFYAGSSVARDFAAADRVDRELFQRHTIETILRIRLARIADSKVIGAFTKSDPFAAQKWSKYTEEEMLHDRLFLKDLKNLGLTERAVYATEPLLATKLLQGYLYYTLEHEGPCGVLSKAYFVEFTSRKTQAQWNDNIARSLGEHVVKGAQAHLNYDIDEDHSSDVWNVLMGLVQCHADEQRVLQHLDVYFGLFTAYFNELANGAPGRSAFSVDETPAQVIRGARRAQDLSAAQPKLG